MTRQMNIEGTDLYPSISSLAQAPYDYKYSVWLAGYWEDFTCAYAVAEAIDNQQAHENTHYGNPINSEARLNPYYRWSFVDRDSITATKNITLTDGTTQTVNVIYEGGLVTSDMNRLHNLGSHEHISIDTIRLGQGVDYAGILNSEYPDSNSNSNRYMFGGFAKYNGKEHRSYMMLNPTFSGTGRYYVHSGDYDSTAGRAPIIHYGVRPLVSSIQAQQGTFSNIAGSGGSMYLLLKREDDRILSPSHDQTHVRFGKMTTTAGSYNFDATSMTAYDPNAVLDQTTGLVAWALTKGDGGKEVISAEIESPSGTPFLVVQSVFPSNEIIPGQVFNFAFGSISTPFPSGIIGDVAGQWTTGDLSFTYNNPNPSGFENFQYHRLQVGDIVRVAGNGLSVVQEKMLDDYSLILYDFENGNLIDNHETFDPSHASYVGGGAQLGTVPLSRFIYPVINYKGNLNSKNDGDTFHMRFCPQNVNFNALPNEARAIHYILKIGYDASRIDWTENGNRFKETGTPLHPQMHNACVEIDLRLGTGSAAKTGDADLFPQSLNYMPRTVDLYANTLPVPKQEAYIDFDDTGTVTAPNYHKVHDFWIDLDVVMDYTNQRFEVFVDGRPVATHNMLPKPSGGNWTPEDLYGWHLDSAAKNLIYSPPTDTQTYDGGADWTQDQPNLLATLIDRVGMVFEITKPLGDRATVNVSRKDSPITALDVNMTLDKSSTCNLRLADDTNDLQIQKIMKDTTSDWKILLFKDNIDTVYWMGEINSLSIQQNARDNTKEVRLNGTDAMAELDRLMPYWEVGQNAYGPSQTYVYRRNEAQMNTENFYLGTRRLMRSSAHLGMDHLSRATSPFNQLDENDAVEGYYAPKFEQRMRLYSSNPIQMYSGEEGYGRFVSMEAEEWLTNPTAADWSDSVWNQWATKRIIGFSDGSRHIPMINGVENTNAQGRLIIAHCIEHNLKVSDTFKIYNTTGQSDLNPFTKQTGVANYVDGVDITVEGIIDKNHFLFSYNGDIPAYGPRESEPPSFHSIIRRPSVHGGLWYGGAYGYQTSSNTHTENKEYLTQIYRGTYTNNHEDKTVHRFIIDGRLMSSFHTEDAITDISGSSFSTEFDNRVNWFGYAFSSQFHNYPWSGEPEAEVRAGVSACMGAATSTREELADYYTKKRANGWYKYEAIGFKPCAIVRVGTEWNNKYIISGPSLRPGDSFILPAENHDDLATVGPAYWCAAHGVDVSLSAQGLAYLGNATEERSQIYTIANTTRQFQWDGSIRTASGIPYDTANASDLERYTVWLRGNDIDKVDPIMPTEGLPHTAHTSTSFSPSVAGPLTRNSRNNDSDAIPMGPVHAGVSALSWDMHQGLRKMKIASATLDSGSDGTIGARYSFVIDGSNPSASPLTGSTDPLWNVKKYLIPVDGGEVGHYNSNLGKHMVFHYDSFDPNTDTFTGCKFAFSADAGPISDWGLTVSPSNLNYLTLNIHPVICTAQAVFHPPTGRTSKSRNRASHALWLQDIRRSNWFKMVFGVIENEAHHHQGPALGVPAIKGGLFSPHNQGRVEQYTTESTDFFTLTADHEAGDSTITFTPHCAIPMFTTDYKEHSVELDAWGLNLRDKGTDPTISIPSKASNSTPNRDNGGLIFEIYTPEGKLDVGIGQSARMINCKDSTDPSYTHWEIVRIQQEELQGFEDTMNHLGISAGVNAPGPIWITAAHDSDSAWNASAGDFYSNPLGLGDVDGRNPDMYHSGNPAAVSGLQGFSNIAIGDTIFLGNTAGSMLFPPTSDSNEHWNPNNPTGGYRDLISYRWYVVIDKRSTHDICIFPAEYAYVDEDQEYTTTLGTMQPKHIRAHFDYPTNHVLPRGLGSNPHTPSAGSAFPAMGGPVMCKLYCGDIQVSGVKFTKGKHLTGARGRFRKIRNDFRHIYILWADMRNDGSADADGGRRKDNFGLMFPTEENYDVNLLYALSQTDITSFKMGEDVDIWQMDSLDPYTGAVWSNNYTNTLSGTMLPAEYLHNWEDKAGSFLIIDTSKFFNLNTYANNGRIGQMSGGKKDLGDIVVQSQGFPELLDNYWWWVMPHPMTAKYRHPYDPSWRTVCRYTTKLTHEIENAKPFMVIDASPNYAGMFYDSLRVEGSHDWKPNSNEPGQLGTSDTIVSGTWAAYGSLVTDYNEANESDAKRIYFNLGSRIRDADTETTGESFAETYRNEQDGMNVIKPINEHNIYQNWAATHNLPMMMSVDGYIETPTSNSYWEHDKMRICWQNSNKLTWLSGGRMPVQYDIGEVPISKDISTTQQPTLDSAEIDSYGSVVDGRGKTYQRIIRMSQDSSGRGYDNGIITKYHYSIERGKFTYRPCYSSFLTLNRDNLKISQMKMSSTGSADYVRVFFNNGESFVDFPQPLLNSDTQSSKWKMVDAGHIASAGEAKALAIQTYEAGKKAKMKIQAQIIRESGQNDLLAGGRHGHISTPCLRHLPSLAPSAPSPLHHWSILSGCMFAGRQNALDGNLDGTLHTNLVGETYGTHNTVDSYGDIHDEIFIGKQADSEWNSQGRGYHGHGVSDPYSMANSATEAIYASRTQHSYGWYGIGSVDKAIQVVHVPKAMNKTSSTTTSELRIIITHDSNTAYEGIYRIHLFDLPFYPDAERSRHIDFNNFDWLTNHSSVRVKTNGIIEIPVPSSYGSGSIVFSFNKEYCDALLKYRSNQSDATKSGKGNRVDFAYTLNNTITGYNSAIHSFNVASTKNVGSAFPLGLTEWAHDVGHDSSRYRNGYNWLHKGQAFFYAPKVKIVDDWVWRPGRTVNYVDSHLDINEQLNVASVQISLREQNHESVVLNMQRDDSQAAESARAFQLPNLGASYRRRPEPPAPPVSPSDPDGGSGGGSGGGGEDKPRPPVKPYPPRPPRPPSVNPVNPLQPFSPSRSGLVISAPANSSGRGDAMGTDMGTVETHDGETHDVGATGTYGIKSQTAVGAPNQTNDGIGAYFTGDKVSINNLTKGAYNAVKGTGDLLGEAGIEGDVGLLGVNRNRSSHLAATRQTDFIIQSKSITSGAPALTQNGFTLPGRINYAEGVAQASQDYHEIMLTAITPNGSNGGRINIKAKISCPTTVRNPSEPSQTISTRFTVFTHVECVETGEKLESQINFDGGNKTISLINQNFKGASGINTLKIKVGRVPNGANLDQSIQEGEDNGEFVSISFDDVRVYVNRKQKGGAFTNTRTDKLRAKDTTKGYYSGTTDNHAIGGKEEDDAAGVSLRTNEGNMQSPKRTNVD